MKGSYELNSFTQNRSTEVTRLKSQVELFYKKELEIYNRIGFKNGTNVIECGCGPGHLLFNLANEYPDCTFTGIEIDKYLYEVFCENISKLNTSNIKAKHGSIYQTEEPDESYDVVIARLVLEHLDNPFGALKELYRILKPGGKIIIVSNDFEYHVLTFPHIPELDLMYKAYCNSRIDEGGNPYIGRELPTYLSKIGAQNINLNIAGVHSNIIGDKALLKAENVNISRSLVQNGYLKQETLDILSNKWYEMLQDPKHIIYRQLFVVSGEKRILKFGDNSLHDKTNLNSENEVQGQLNNKSGSDKITKYLINKILESFDDDMLEIDPHVKLNDYYIDSLIATEIAGILKSNFAVEIKLSNILNNYSIADLVKVIESNSSTSKIEKKPNQEEWSEGEL